MRGLVLTAGGARGAYQAGVLQRIGEIPALRGRPTPFPIITGASAGALNGTVLAAGAGDFAAVTRRLAQIWSELKITDVFRTDAMSLGTGGVRLLKDLTLGGFFGGGAAQSLLDASPLRGFLERNLPLAGIGQAIRDGHLYAVGVSATSYHSGKSYTFIQGRPGHPLWLKSRRVALAVELTVEHVCASAAIPILFQPVCIHSPAGAFYFGDGGLRLVTPFSPAIRLGATHVFAIGVRCQRASAALMRREVAMAGGGGEPVHMPRPPLSQICGVFLNAIFLDHLDTDLDHLQRMNELIAVNGSAKHDGAAVSEPMRRVEPLTIDPSQDLALVAEHHARRMPALVRYLMEGLGPADAQSADLMSYLLFDASYTRALVEIGYEDASTRIDEIEAFLLPRV